MSNSKPSKQIYEYLKRIMRPDSAQNIVNNLNTCKKADVTKALDKLVDEEKVIVRTNGKFKIYYLNQKELKKNMNEDTSELDQKVLTASESLKCTENKIKAIETELNVFKGKQSKTELEAERSTLLKKLKEVQSQLESMGSKKEQKENKSKKYDLELVSRECRKRKRITKEIIDNIEEFASKPKKKLLEEIGIEFYN